MVVVVGNDKHLCAGSLITPTFVLTAARCVARYENFTLYLGAHDMTAREKSRVGLITTLKVVHSGYNETTGHNDIAVIELPRKVRPSEHIQLVELPRRKDLLLDSDVASISGWGLYKDNGNPSAVLLHTVLDVITNAECYQKYGHDSIIHSELCAVGYDNRSPCDGDEGAPLVIARNGIWKQVGIMSHRLNTVCSNNSVSSFTRLSAYLDWLEANTGVNVD
ncbi:chymotrypsin [Anabrus simplex]|uniref:chymotrypsin n=1 Tax=Anabrus simplex TaxID=316456 RepID=UPI0035A3CE8D